MLTLVIEASTVDGSVALLHGAWPVDGAGTAAPRLLGVCRVVMGPSQEDLLFPAVAALLDARPVGSVVGAVVCGAGPGSFTSLRIAAAVAKGIAQATGARLFAVPSLLLAAAACDRPGRYLVHADAMRGERYALPVEIDAALTVRARGDLRRVTMVELTDDAGGAELLAVGASAATAFVLPDAARLARVEGWRERGEVDLASWEPAYGRLAEAQVKWEAAHSRPLPTA